MIGAYGIEYDPRSKKSKYHSLKIFFKKSYLTQTKIGKRSAYKCLNIQKLTYRKATYKKGLFYKSSHIQKLTWKKAHIYCTKAKMDETLQE